MKPELVRKVGGSAKSRSRSRSKKGDSLAKGSRVEARYRGRSRWVAGEVSRVNVNGTFDIRYDDGKRENGVAADLVRAVDAAGGASASDSDGKKSDSEEDAVELDVGAAVEARFGGKARWYKGTIMRKRRDGSFDIEYEDGDKELRVKPELVRKVGGSAKSRSRSRSKKGDSLAKGSRVEARYRGRSRWVAGEVSRVNVNGTFDIRYDDGKRENGVAADLVRAVDAAGGASASDSDGKKSDSAEDAVELDVGAAVEARFGGKARWYKGTIMRKRRDGSFDIEYEDGDNELRVKPELVRKVGGSAKSRSRSRSKKGDSLAKGSRVEARYRGRSRWVAGEVSRVNVNGTFDIRYDDGKRENGVAADLVRAVDAAGGASASDSDGKKSDSEEDAVELDVGAAVEARFGGRLDGTKARSCASAGTAALTLNMKTETKSCG